MQLVTAPRYAAFISPCHGTGAPDPRLPEDWLRLYSDGLQQQEVGFLMRSSARALRLLGDPPALGHGKPTDPRCWEYAHTRLALCVHRDWA